MARENATPNTSAIRPMRTPARTSHAHTPIMMSMVAFSPKFWMAIACPVPTVLWPRSCSNAFNGTTKKPPAAPISANTQNATGNEWTTDITHTATPISTPLGSARCALDTVTNLPASAAPSTMPTAVMALRYAGVRLLRILSANGTQAINRNRMVEPMPQNRQVPAIENRASRTAINDRHARVQGVCVRRQRGARAGAGLGGAVEPQCALHVPVCERASGNGPHQNGGDGGGLDEAVGFDQLRGCCALREDSVFCRRIRGRTDADETVGKKGIQANANPDGADELQAIGDQHCPALRQEVRQGSRERGGHNVGGDKELL